MGEEASSALSGVSSVYHNHHEDYYNGDNHGDDQQDGRTREIFARHISYEDHLPTDHQDVPFGERYIDSDLLNEERYNEDLYQEESAFQEPLYEEHLHQERHYDERSYEERSYEEPHNKEPHNKELPYKEHNHREHDYRETGYQVQGDGQRYDEALFETDRHHTGHDHQTDDLYHSERHTDEVLRDPDIYDYYHEPQGVLFAEDFNDTQHYTRNRFTETMGKIGLGITAVVFAIGFAAITFIAGKPPMTPHEIVQMDGYQGSKSHQTLYFNLASLRGCSNIADCDDTTQSETGNNSSQSSPSIKTTPGLRTITQTDNEDRYAAGENSSYREIPAVSASATQTGINIVENASQWKVKKQWSIVRETPASNGAIITSLAADKHVAVISTIGEWFEISTDSTSSKPEPLGFMHSSLLQPL